MCPCPFCTTIAILFCPLLLFKRSRKWLKSKIINRHHRSCEVCQHAEHEQHMHDHTPCHCRACKTKAVVAPKKSGKHHKKVQQKSRKRKS